MAISLLLALALGTAPLPSLTTPEAAATEFLDAFKSMDQARFDQFFAPDVTMFFPDGPFPKTRVEGREAVLASFHEFFALVRKRGRTALNITPINRRVQLYGEVAVVSFGLESDETVGRPSCGKWEMIGASSISTHLPSINKLPQCPQWVESGMAASGRRHRKAA